MNLLTLPEFFYRRYGKTTELATSVITVTCFIVLIAGNLSAVAWILSNVSGLSYGTALAIGTAVILLYTIAGGLYAAIWTDFFQIHIAIVGFLLGAGWLCWNRGFDTIMAAVPAATLSLSQMFTVEGGGLVNWAALLSLAVGNAMALDFMERVFSARTPGQPARPATTPRAGHSSSGSAHRSSDWPACPW
jgi:solute:Na+ symporter, SSS family